MGANITPSIRKSCLNQCLNNKPDIFNRIDLDIKTNKGFQLISSIENNETNRYNDNSSNSKEVSNNQNNQKYNNDLSHKSLQSSIISNEKMHLNSTIHIYPENKDYPTAFAYIKEKELLITGMSNGILIFTNKTISSEEKVLLCHCKKITSLISLNDNKSIISGSKDGIIYKHDSDYYESTIIGTEDSIDAMADLNNGFTILVASNNTVIAYDYMENRKLYSFIAHDEEIKDMIYHMANDLLVTSSKDKKIKLWNTATQECIGVLKGINHTISLCFAQKKNDLIIVSASRDGFVTFWNLSKKSLTKIYNIQTATVKVIYLNNERDVISINKNGFITIFNIDSNNIKNVKNNQTHIEYTTAIYFDNNTIVLGTKHAMVQLWLIN